MRKAFIFLAGLLASLSAFAQPKALLRSDWTTTTNPVTAAEGLFLSKAGSTVGPGINVLLTGADATGATDSTLAFDRAITNALATSRKVYVPAGTYKLNIHQRIPTAAYALGLTSPQLELYGDGMKSTYLIAETTSSPILWLEGGTPYLHDFSLVSTGGYCGLLFGTNMSNGGVYGVTLKNIGTYGFQHGINMYGPNASMLDNVVFSYCTNGISVTNFGNAVMFNSRWAGLVGEFNQTNITFIGGPASGNYIQGILEQSYGPAMVFRNDLARWEVNQFDLSLYMEVNNASLYTNAGGPFPDIDFQTPLAPTNGNTATWEINFHDCTWWEGFWTNTYAVHIGAPGSYTFQRFVGTPTAGGAVGAIPYYVIADSTNVTITCDFTNSWVSINHMIGQSVFQMPWAIRNVQVGYEDSMNMLSNTYLAPLMVTGPISHAASPTEYAGNSLDRVYDIIGFSVFNTNAFYLTNLQAVIGGVLSATNAWLKVIQCPANQPIVNFYTNHAMVTVLYSNQVTISQWVDSNTLASFSIPAVMVTNGGAIVAMFHSGLTNGGGGVFQAAVWQNDSGNTNNPRLVPPKVSYASGDTVSGVIDWVGLTHHFYSEGSAEMLLEGYGHVVNQSADQVSLKTTFPYGLITPYLSADRYLASTNTGTVTPDFTKSYSLFSTNSSFAFNAPANGDTAKANTTTIIVTNSSGVLIDITPPTGITSSQGTWNCTNLTAVTFFQFGRSLTNATAMPLK